MKTFTVQFKFQPEARAKVCGIRAETAAQAIAEAARDLRLTPYDVGDPVNDTADFSSILEAIDTTPTGHKKTLIDQIRQAEAAMLRLEHNPDNYIGGLKAYNSGRQTFLKPAAQKKLDKLSRQLDQLLDQCEA